MNSFPGYIHLELVHEFSQCIIYRAQHEKTNQPVIIKHFKEEYSDEQLLKIKKQFSYKGIQKLSSIPRPVEILYLEGMVTLVLKDTGSMFLSVILLNRQLSLSEFINYAIKITRSLGEIHTRQIVHNDIRPHCILVNEQTGEISFTSQNARKMSLTRNTIKPPLTIGEDAFVFTSPEQTGRINWKIDQRSDLYSLGITFYSMLNGQPPFLFDASQKRIHGHLAVDPESLKTVRPNTPDVIDNIIKKLISKSAEDRYQSAFGLLKDLEICRDQYENNQQIELFKLAQKDNIERFQIPSKLYGSQRNIVALIESFNRVCTGSVEMMTITGRAGMGKTTLIKELLGLAKQKKAYIAHGKCEKEYRDTPYYSLIKSFQLLVRQILSEGKQNQKKWKERFLENLGHNGQLVIDFIPEMELIIGPQPNVPKLDSDEAQNRLSHTFRRFIQTFTQESKPLVIFLDRLHWADAATIQLIQVFLTDINIRYMMMIIAYQEQLIIHANTLAITFDEIVQSGTNVQQIQVNPLGLNDICLMIEEALSFKQDFQSLAQFIIDKTEGNPYFVKQLLKTLYENKLIHFEPSLGQWNWDLTQIREANIPDNVVELMADKVRNLHPETIEILKTASCIGNQFDLKTLAIATGRTEKDVKKQLKQPVEADLIHPVQRGWQYPYNLIDYDNQPNPEHNKSYQFTHSRVSRATYSLLSAKDKKICHLRLGRILKENTSEEQSAHNTYKIVNHMNQGLRLIEKQSERHELARLNLIAGKESKSTAAIETAWKFFSLGSELVSEGSWENDYDLTKELYLRRSECEYFIGNTDAAEPIFDLLFQHLKTNQEKVEVYNLKLNLYIKNSRLEEAIEIGIEALEVLFGEKVPPNDAEITIISQMKMQDNQAELEQRGIENILFLPVMKSPEKKAVMDLITNIIPAAYLVKRNLWIMLTLKMVEISLEYGNTDSSAFGYMNHAVILCSGLQDYDSGYAMGRLALNLNNKFNNRGLISQLNFLFGSYIGHWKNKARENLTYLRRSYQAGIEQGDLISAGLSVDFLMKSHIIVGSPLEEIQKEAKKHQDFVEQLNNSDLKNVLEISKLMIVLRDSEPDSRDFVPDLDKTEKLIDSIKESKNSQLLHWYYLINAQINYLFYNKSKALKMIQESDKLTASYSQLAIPEHYFYYSLIILENYTDFNEDEKKRFWDILKSNHQKLASLAKDCPINFMDKSLIIEAQMAGISGNYIKAGELYDEAIKAAYDNDFVQNEAIANEMAAKYFLSRNKLTIATAYIRKSCRSYIKWGATAKIKHLEKYYPMLLKKRRRFDDAIKHPDDPDKVSIFSDLSTIDKASQRISSEATLENKIEILLQMILENINAQKGYFLIEKGNQLKIIAEGLKQKDVKIKPLMIPLEEFEQIAQSVVFYVIRTRKLIALDDASKDGMFAYNKYIKETNPKSILCIPIVTHEKLNAILYLENSTSIGAFSPRLIDLLTTLLSHVSISIENSLLYENVLDLTNQLKSSKETLEKRIQVLEQELASRIL